MAAMKTPGVYIVEKSAFPNSVVAVATAVPAFIGHTRIAVNGTKSLFNTPFRITSMLEYETYFGGAPTPEYNLNLTNENEIKKLNKELADKDQKIVEAEKPAIEAAEAMKVAEKEYKDAVIAAAAATPDTKADLDAKVVAAKAKFDAAVNAATEATTKAQLAKEPLISDRNIIVGKIDNLIKQLFNPANPGWNLTPPTPLYTLYYNMVLFFANGGGSCYIVSVGDYQTKFSLEMFNKGIESLVKEQEPTMLVIPEAVNKDLSMWKSITEQTLAHCGNEKLRNRVAILDIFDGYKPMNDPDGDVVSNFRNNVGSNYLDYAAAYYPWVCSSVVSENAVKVLNLKNPESLLLIMEKEVNCGKDIQIKNSVNRFDLEQTYKTIDADASITDKEKDKKAACLEIAKKDPLTMKKAEEDKADKEKPATDTDIAEAAEKTLAPLSQDAKAELAQLLLPSSPFGQQVIKAICKDINLLPVAAAMAGIYTKTDNTRGVWKAPANVSVNRVDAPAVKLTDDMQEDLNVDLNGRSINALRYFKGEGVKVWGGRTLLGNSLDWRYINVRRTMIFLEESIKNAARAYVFEPNVAATWLNMKSMIESFLMGVWKQGGLAGASPEDAYSVHVGLGQTMTAEDILEGRLLITVLVAISHPAEFIEITFQQQMQKS